MLRFSLVAVLALTAVPAVAQTEKEVSCGHQADLTAAVVQARLDGVAERDVPEELAKIATWPENYTAVMVPVIAPYIYEQKRRDLRKSDLRSTTYAQCMSLN